jgi:hypothetical protein
MIIAAADVTLRHDQNLLLRLKNTVNNIANDWSARRTEIAHGIVMHFSANERDIGWYLVPASYSTKKNDPWNITDHFSDEAFLFDPYAYAYTAAQVATYANAFAERGKDVTALLTEVQSFLRRKFPDS